MSENSLLPNLLSPGTIIRLANRMLSNINSDLVKHNERTAFLVLSMIKNCNLPSECSLQNLILLSLFHTIGFFRIDLLTGFDPYGNEHLDYFSDDKQVLANYRFGCYYLNYMTPIGNDAYALADFTKPFNKKEKKDNCQIAYKSIIYLCSRISAYYAANKDSPFPDDINSIAPGKFDPEYVEIFKLSNQNNELINQFEDDLYHEELRDYLQTLEFSTEQNQQLLKLLVYILDFKSTYTFKHSINTSCYALSLGQRMGLDEESMNILFTSSFLHDIGKIATPQEILEAPGKLSPEKMGIMKLHVKHSKKILTSLVPEEIIKTVFHHHEKLNGQGYPQNLSAEKLTVLDRILTVADITSALCDSRSYKTEFSKVSVMIILSEMAEKGEIDKIITSLMQVDFDEIQQERIMYQDLFNSNYDKVMQLYTDYYFNEDEQTSDFAEEITDLLEEF